MMKKTDLALIVEWHLENGIDVVLSDSPVNSLELLNNDTTSSDSIYISNSRVAADASMKFSELVTKIKEFNGCGLKVTAINTVVGEGSESADIMFIGEAPGASEDKEGIPFCGQSGKLLNNILKSINLKREDVFITNTVFWRPPANRRPTATELEICKPFLEKMIYFINPKVIILVGSTAVESLLSSKISMHDLREGNFEYQNQYLAKSIPTYVIFHPSYLLRQAVKKKLMWFDMIKIKKAIAQQ